MRHDCCGTGEPKDTEVPKPVARFAPNPTRKERRKAERLLKNEIKRNMKEKGHLNV